MTVYLVGTDGAESSRMLARFVTDTARADDRIEAVHVLTDSDVERADAGDAALDAFEAELDGAFEIRTRQLNRGRSPAAELLAVAEDVDADHIVTGLRQHSRTERIIFGSVSQSLVKQTDRPVTLVPLPSYTVAEEPEAGTEAHAAEE
jgi:nucleotide-binding universal stress UspA family protein